MSERMRELLEALHNQELREREAAKLELLAREAANTRQEVRDRGDRADDQPIVAAMSASLHKPKSNQDIRDDVQPAPLVSEHSHPDTRGRVATTQDYAQDISYMDRGLQGLKARLDINAPNYGEQCAQIARLENDWADLRGRLVALERKEAEPMDGPMLSPVEMRERWAGYLRPGHSGEQTHDAQAEKTQEKDTAEKKPDAHDKPKSKRLERFSRLQRDDITRKVGSGDRRVNYDDGPERDEDGGRERTRDYGLER